MKNIDLDYKIMAKCFGKTPQAMHIAKSRYNKGEKSLWKVYVEAYNFRNATPPLSKQQAKYLREMLKEKVETNESIVYKDTIIYNKVLEETLNALIGE